MTASCREVGGKRKGGKPRGMPGGKESRFLLDLGSAGTSVLLDLNKSKKIFQFLSGLWQQWCTHSVVFSVLYLAARFLMNSL